MVGREQFDAIAASPKLKSARTRRALPYGNPHKPDRLPPGSRHPRRRHADVGAAALGDIGTRFRPDDPSVPEGVSSLDLLERTEALVHERGWKVANVDATIIAERPHLTEHVTAMRNAIASALRLDADCVSIKATTEDGMGFTGSGDGIAAIAIASLSPLSE